MRKRLRQTWQQPQPLRLKAMNAITKITASQCRLNQRCAASRMEPFPPRSTIARSGLKRGRVAIDCKKWLCTWSAECAREAVHTNANDWYSRMPIAATTRASLQTPPTSNEFSKAAAPMCYPCTRPRRRRAPPTRSHPNLMPGPRQARGGVPGGHISGGAGRAHVRGGRCMCGTHSVCAGRFFPIYQWTVVIYQWTVNRCRIVQLIVPIVQLTVPIFQSTAAISEFAALN